MDEQQTVKLVKEGDSDAYRQLIERYQVGVIIYCENIVKDRSVAEDIAQEAFVKAYYSIKKYDPSKAAFSTWLYRITVNIAKDHIRKHKKHLNLGAIEEVINEREGLTTAEKREVFEKVQSLQPPEYSEVIKAYFWEGKRYEDIAKHMNVPIGTISTWMNRAKQLLRKELA